MRIPVSGPSPFVVSCKIYALRFRSAAAAPMHRTSFASSPRRAAVRHDFETRTGSIPFLRTKIQPFSRMCTEKCGRRTKKTECNDCTPQRFGNKPLPAAYPNGWKFSLPTLAREQPADVTITGPYTGQAAPDRLTALPKSVLLTALPASACTLFGRQPAGRIRSLAEIRRTSSDASRRLQHGGTLPGGPQRRLPGAPDGATRRPLKPDGRAPGLGPAETNEITPLRHPAGRPSHRRRPTSRK